MPRRHYFARATRELAFLAAKTWPIGTHPPGRPLGDHEVQREDLIALLIERRWRQAVAVSPYAVAWVDAAEIEPSKDHLFDLHPAMREAMAERWGVASEPHDPPNPAAVFDRAWVRREILEEHPDARLVGRL